MKLPKMVALLLAVGMGSTPATAQTCPSEYAACDNGGCCLSSEQCCPTLEEGCCGSSTPYCCGDGTCAATPSQCELAGRRIECDGYDVPCGAGCAPAGSDCCDVAGHYCPPESMCTSDTTCVFGAQPTLAREVPPTSGPGIDVTPGLSPPFRDPADATRRSCALGPALRPPPPLGHWPVVAMMGLLSLRRRRLPRRH